MFEDHVQTGRAGVESRIGVSFRFSATSVAGTWQVDAVWHEPRVRMGGDTPYGFVVVPQDRP